MLASEGNVQYGSIPADESSGTAIVTEQGESAESGNESGNGGNKADDDGDDDENFWAKRKKDPRKGWLAYFRAFFVSLRSLGSDLEAVKPIYLTRPGC